MQPRILKKLHLSIYVFLLKNIFLFECSCSNLGRHEIEPFLSTKTPYRAVANLNETPYEFGAGCRPAKIWGIIRHGSRNPSKEVIERVQKDLLHFKTEILKKPQQTQFCNEELDRLRKWQFNITAKEEKFLVAEGENELVELAERMQKRFPKLLLNQYAPEYFYFKYTKTQRTLKSAESFATGLFGRDHIKQIIYPEALQRDPVLRVWADFKNHTKLKLRKNRNDMQRTGGGPSRFIPLSPLEEKVAELLRMDQAVNGLSGANHFGGAEAVNNIETGANEEVVDADFTIISEAPSSSERETGVINVSRRKRSRSNTISVNDTNSLLKKQVDNQITYQKEVTKILSEMNEGIKSISRNQSEMNEGIKSLSRYQRKLFEVQEKELEFKEKKFRFEKENEVAKQKLKIEKFELKKRILEQNGK